MQSLDFIRIVLFTPVWNLISYFLSDRVNYHFSPLKTRFFLFSQLVKYNRTKTALKESCATSLSIITFVSIAKIIFSHAWEKSCIIMIITMQAWMNFPTKVWKSCNNNKIALNFLLKKNIYNKIVRGLGTILYASKSPTLKILYY